MKQTPAYDIANNELLSLVPPNARRVVDVGCMTGAMAREIRNRSPCTEVVGMDIDPDYAAAAERYCTKAFSCDIETIEPTLWARLFPSDCWIFGDCLEHLRDPWRLLLNVRRAIDQDGSLLVCLPNAQHWSVQWRLASGQFRYEDSGLMDRTHIRWFTRTTMLEMFQSTGWRVASGLTRNLPAVPQQEGILQALRGMAVAGGFDPEQAVYDAQPFQYVFKCIPDRMTQVAPPEAQRDHSTTEEVADHQAESPTLAVSVPASRCAANAATSVVPLTDESVVPPVHLYQIVYSAATAAEANYHMLDNFANERPDWREYWPIRRFLIKQRLDENAFYGFFSPKFGAKTNLSHSQVTAFVQANATHGDVMLFSPQPDMGAFFLNVFEQAELFDPGLIDAYSAFLAHIDRPLALHDLLMDSRHVVFSNYFVARPAFWREWLAINEPLFDLCEGADTPLRLALCARTTYPGAVERKVFLQERAASLLLATQPRWRSVAYNPFGMGWSMSRFRQHPTDAVISDALKMAFRDHAYPQYLEAFGSVRERFRGSDSFCATQVRDKILTNVASQIPLPPDQYIAAVGGGDFREIGSNLLDLLANQGGLSPNHDVLDIGCGCGRVAAPLTTFLAPTAKYSGFDILQPLVAWCQENISRKFPNFEFFHVNLQNTFYDAANEVVSSAEDAAQHRFQYSDATFDYVLATSVFTHLNTSCSVAYIDEVSRVLRPGGRAFLTFFLMNDDYNMAISQAYPVNPRFDFGGYPYWFFNSEKPEWAVAHDESFIIRKIRDVGLSVDAVLFGSWKGRKAPTYQDIIIVSKQ